MYKTNGVWNANNPAPVIDNKDSRKFLPQFSEFALQSDIVKTLLQYGKKPAPLQLIGTFLSFAGNAMLHDIWSRFKRKVFYGGHKVVRI